MVTRIGRPSGPSTARHFAREWREHRGLSQDDVCDRLSEFFGRTIGRNRLSKKETGSEKLDEEWIFGLAKALNIEPGWIFVRPDIALKDYEKIKVVTDATPEEVSAVLAFIRARKAS